MRLRERLALLLALVLPIVLAVCTIRFLDELEIAVKIAGIWHAAIGGADVGYVGEVTLELLTFDLGQQRIDVSVLDLFVISTRLIRARNRAARLRRSLSIGVGAIGELAGRRGWGWGKKGNGSQGVDITGKFPRNSGHGEMGNTARNFTRRLTQRLAAQNQPTNVGACSRWRIHL